MLEHTLYLINSFSQMAWFSEVGKPLQRDVIKLHSWHDVVDALNDEKYERLHNKVRNEMTDIAFKKTDAKYPNSSRNWNKVVREVKAYTAPLVELKTDNLIRRLNLPVVLRNKVNWDMLHIFMSCEYSDVYTPTFYSDLALWYVRGHFPCGWKGNYPEGKLIVF